MPGVKKSAIARRISEALSAGGCEVLVEGLVGPKGDLPWQCEAVFPDGSRRTFRLYFWTISHGGRTRSQDEYRIQAKLKTARRLEFGLGTTLLLGYYLESEDRVGRAEGNSPTKGMEVFVAWDPLQHLRVGASSSCQVRFDLLHQAYLHGIAMADRRIADGVLEQVVAVRPEHLWRYLRSAAGGHNSLNKSLLRL